MWLLSGCMKYVYSAFLSTGGCKVANGIGIMVVIAVFFAFIAIFEHPKFVKKEDNLNLLQVGK